MTVSKKLATLTAITALAATGVAGAAEAPVVSAQANVAGAAPWTIPGTGIQKGEWMGGKAVLAVRSVTLEQGQKATITLKATGKRRIAGIAVPEGQRVAVQTLDPNYVGKRQVTVTATLAPRSGAGEHVGFVSALTR